MVCYIVEEALIGVTFMRSGGCGMLEWQEFGDFTGCLGWAFSHHQAIAYPQELRMVEESTSDTGLVSSLRQALLKLRKEHLSDIAQVIL